MEKLIWTDKCFIGKETIDKQHREMMGCINFFLITKGKH